MKIKAVEKLVKIGFSEYEAKAYIALLEKSPITGYELSKLSGVPRSMIYEVAGKLVGRGAAMTQTTDDSTRYAPVPSDEFLKKYLNSIEDLVTSLRDELASFSSIPDLEYVWNIEGHNNIISKAIEMIRQSSSRICLALVPGFFHSLKSSLENAVSRGVSVNLYTTEKLELTGSKIVVAQVAEGTLGRAQGLGLVLVIDGKELLISEWRTPTRARASWATSPLLVFITEHHLRTDPYLPKILFLLGDQAREIIQEEDWELFAQTMESHISIIDSTGGNSRDDS